MHKLTFALEVERPDGTVFTVPVRVRGDTALHSDPIPEPGRITHFVTDLLGMVQRIPMDQLDQMVKQHDVLSWDDFLR